MSIHCSRTVATLPLHGDDKLLFFVFLDYHSSVPTVHTEVTYNASHPFPHYLLASFNSCLIIFRRHVQVLLQSFVEAVTVIDTRCIFDYAQGHHACLCTPVQCLEIS